MLTSDSALKAARQGAFAPSEAFYQQLEGFSRFSRLTDPSHYQDAPEDWYVLATDIKGSTQAIADGKYKEVNLIGAAVIMAILNIAGNASLPYCFGGDGANMLIPPSLLDKTLATLASVQAKVKASFDMELRGGCIPIAALYREGARLLVGKYHLSPNVSQAVFQGNALSLAETWLKKGGGTVLTGALTAGADPDLQGLECRWEPIANRNGKMLSVLVKIAPSHASQGWQLYDEIIHNIDAIYPESAHSHPAYTSGLNISFRPSNLIKESKLRGGRHVLTQLIYLLRIMILNAIGQFAFKTGINIGSFDGAKYLSEMVANSDARKFDEMLRMVLDSTEEQHAALEKLLRGYQEKGMVNYGIHVSSQALMTCLVFNLSGNHVHLIDGADGGYALAAKQMKQQMSAA